MGEGATRGSKKRAQEGDLTDMLRRGERVIIRNILNVLQVEEELPIGQGDVQLESGVELNREKGKREESQPPPIGGSGGQEKKSGNVQNASGADGRTLGSHA